MPDPIVGAALQSEYTTKYTTKPELSKINTATIMSAYLISRATKTAQQVATSIISKCLNTINGTITYPLVLLSTYLLGHGDHFMSHVTAVHSPYAFTVTLLPLSSARDLDGTTCEVVHQDPVSNDSGSVIHTLPPLDYYRARHQALSAWSPVEMVMAFKAGKAQTLPAKQLLLLDTHPLHLTHGHTPLAIECLPQLVSEPPSRPSSTAIPSECEAYAAFAISNFFSDWLFTELHGANLWEKMLDWEARHPRGWPDRLAWRMLGNIQLRVRARLLMAEDAREVRAQLKSSKAAGRKQQGSSEQHGGHDPHDDDDEYDVGGCNEDMLMRLDRMVTTDALELQLGTDRYFAGALHHLAANAPTHVSIPLHPSEVDCPRDFASFNDTMADAHEAMLQNKPTTSQPGVPTADACKRLYVQTCNPGNVIASVRYVGLQPEPRSVHNEIQAANVALLHGGKPPYIKMDRLPTVDETIALFHLCDEQAFPFRILTNTLQKEVANEECDQLLLTVFGGPGSGKSEVLAAFLWHVYQHGCADMVAVVSYTWKAALLVGTASNPGCSTTTFFGTKMTGGNRGAAARRPQKPGNTKRCKERLHQSIRIVVWDENSSFTDLVHFAVSQSTSIIQRYPIEKSIGIWKK